MQILETIQKSNQKLYKLSNEKKMMAYNLESSALSLHKKRCKKSSVNQKSKLNLRRHLSIHYKIEYKYNVIHNLSFLGRSQVLKYVICGNKKILIVMFPGTTLPLSGLYNLKLICGKIDMLGYSMDNVEQTVFSNEIDGIIDITCTDGIVLHKRLNNILIENRVHPTLYQKLKNYFQNQSVCLLLVKRNHSMLSSIIRKTKYSTFCRNMQNVRKSPAIAVFQLNTNLRPLLKNAIDHVGILDIPKSWLTFANKLKDQLCKDNPSQPCIVVCGGRNTGKSTLVRYLCNSFLSLHNINSVAVLDCDPLRPEVSSPGNLSVSILSLPILGPASLRYESMTFSFRREIVFTSPLPSDCLSEYFAIIKSLRETSRQFDMPIIVNTMGYKKCLQLEIIVNLIRIICPSHVLQVHRDDDINSLDVNLSKKKINSLRNLSSCKSTLDYYYHKVQAYTVQEKPGLSIEKLLSYNVLSSMVLSKSTFSSSLNAKNSMKCININYNDYALHAPIPELQPSYLLAAYHMKLVALCEVDTKHIMVSDKMLSKHIRKENKLWNVDSLFHGYGFVLNVDTDEQKFTLLTSSRTNLDPVNAIITVGFRVSKEFAKKLFNHYLNHDKLTEEERSLISTNLSLNFNTSSKEFCNVSSLIFSNRLEEMKTGLQNLYIWRSRVIEVPIGIELTISLLAAQITIQDPNLGEDYRHMLIHGDICRFVNMLCKSYNEDMVEDETSITSISRLINICPVIVEFRNFMTHMTTYIDLEISQRLLEKGMQWVKENYWKGKIKNAERTAKRKTVLRSAENEGRINKLSKNEPVKKIKLEHISIKIEKKNEKSEGIQLSNDDRIEQVSEKFNSAHLIKMPLNHFFSMLDVKRPLFSTDTNFKFEGFMLNIMKLYVCHPEEVMDIIVKEMFLKPSRIYFEDNNKKCVCGSRLTAKLVSHMHPVFEAFTFVENNVSNHFLRTFMVKSKKKKSVFEHWLTVFLENRIENSLCRLHGSVAMNWFSNSIDWKEFTAYLTESTHPWELRIAKRISSKEIEDTSHT